MHICANDTRSRKASGVKMRGLGWQAVTTDMNLTYVWHSRGLSNGFKNEVGVGKVGRTLQIDTRILKAGKSSVRHVVQIGGVMGVAEAEVTDITSGKARKEIYFNGFQ